MSRITIGVDVGGTKTAAAVAIDGKEVSRAEGVGGAVRPGRALASATVIAETVRRALATRRQAARHRPDGRSGGRRTSRGTG